MRIKRLILSGSMGLWAAYILTPAARAAAMLAEAQAPTVVAPDVLMPMIIQGGGFGLAAYFVWWTTQPMTKAVDKCTEATTENTQVLREVKSVLDRRDHNHTYWDGHERRDHRGATND